MSREFTTGLVLAAGGSKRLGQPKQLLPYGSATLLEHVLSTARACSFDQLVCVVGGGADEIETRVNFAGVQVVENDYFGEGCSSSIAAALAACAYDNGRGHPLAFARSTFDQLASLHGDKGVWSCLIAPAMPWSMFRSAERSPATLTPGRTTKPRWPTRPDQRVEATLISSAAP